MLARLFLFELMFLSGSCAVLHHVQVGDVDDRVRKKRPFDIKVSEVGVNLKEAGRLMSRISKSGKAREAMDWISYFQMGPRTGKPVFEANYAKPLLTLIYRECPTGRVTGLTSIRESANYPVISGEIVKVRGWCLD